MSNPFPTPIDQLLEHAAQSADMLEELGADHTAAVLRQHVEAVRSAPAQNDNDQLTTDHKLLLLMAADRYIHDTETNLQKSTALKTQLALEQQLKQLRLARAWIDRQWGKP